MKLLIYHGNGFTSMVSRINAVKKDYDPLSINYISGKDFSWDQTTIQLSTPQLFFEKRLVILEDFDEKINLKALPNDDDLTVILKYSKLLNNNSPVLKVAGMLKAQIMPFLEKDEKSIFPFLDNLADKKAIALTQLDNLYDEYGSQYILTMIFYMLRRMVVPQEKAPYSVRQKIENQKKINFSGLKLEEIYKYALEMDYKIKSGLLEEKMGLILLVNEILKI